MKFNKVVAIGAHPDDIELHVAGLLLKYKAEVHHVVCTSGERYTAKGIVRLKEQQEACKLLGSELYWLDMEFGKLRPEIELVSKLDEIIDQVKPDRVISHWERDHNQDHRAVYWATVAALRRNSAELWVYGGWNRKRHFDYNISVDIGDIRDKKREVLNCFKSQQDREYFKYITRNERFKLEFMQL